MYRIALVNGPNMNLLGKREVGVYGTETLEQLNRKLQELAAELGAELIPFQSNSEGAIIDFLHETGQTCDGIVINPASLSQSYPIAEAITGIQVPAVEVHMSNIYAREAWHSKSMIVPVCVGQVVGFGGGSYSLGLRGLLEHLRIQDSVRANNA